MYKHIDRFNTYRGKPGTRYQRARVAARHPAAIPVMTFVVLAILSGVFFLIFHLTSGGHNPNVVVISHDGNKQVVSSKEATVGSLLSKLELQIHDGDVVEPSLATAIQQDDFRINIYRAAPIEIVDGGDRTFAYSAIRTERSVAIQAGLTVYPEDRLIKEPITDFVSSGGISERVTIERATPVNVNLYGSPIVMRTHANTVKELLDERKIKLLPQDQVNPSVDTPLTALANVAVIRNGLSTVSVEEPIPMPVQSIPDNTLAYGTSAVRQKGAEGKRVVLYEINTQNGQEVGRRKVQETIVQAAVPEIRVIGSNLSGIKGDMARAGIAPGDYQYVDYIVQKESGWNPVARNPSGAYGLCQALPGSKMASAGADWQTNPVTQLRWCNSYAIGRYGTWAAAYNFWVRNHWW